MGKKDKWAGSCCYWCGTTYIHSVEHVPPRGLFSKDNRDSLLVVPSCERHNEFFSGQDTNFLLFLHILSDGLEELGYPSSRGYESRSRATKSLDSALQQNPKRLSFVESVFESGFGRLNKDMIDLFMVKIFRGLWFWETGYPCPYSQDQFTVAVSGMFNSQASSPEGLVEPHKMVRYLSYAWGPLLLADRLGSQPHEFNYRIVRGRDSHIKIMALQFYGNIDVIILSQRFKQGLVKDPPYYVPHRPRGFDPFTLDVEKKTKFRHSVRRKILLRSPKTPQE